MTRRLLRLRLRWAERAVDRPWTRKASVRIDRALARFESLES